MLPMPLSCNYTCKKCGKKGDVSLPLLLNKTWLNLAFPANNLLEYVNRNLSFKHFDSLFHWIENSFANVAFFVFFNSSFFNHSLMKNNNYKLAGANHTFTHDYCFIFLEEIISYFQIGPSWASHYKIICSLDEVVQRKSLFHRRAKRIFCNVSFL